MRSATARAEDCTEEAEAEEDGTSGMAPNNNRAIQENND